MPFVRELKERKIPQTMVFYLGGGWVLIEALNFFIEKYGWTAKIFDVFIILVIFGLPATLLYAWFHGKSGTSKVQKKELIFHGVNLAIAISFIVNILFNPYNIGAKSTNQNIIASESQYDLGESRIAILPFENNTNDPNLDNLGYMAADWVIQGLMSSDDIKVVSFQTAQAHIEFASVGNLETFAGRTGANKIVRGSYYLQGDKLIFYSQLIDAKTGEIELVLPAITGGKNNVEDIVVEIRQRLLTIFIAEFYALKGIRQKPPRYEAYEYLVKGLQLFGVDNDESRKMMNMAISLDSGYYYPYGYIVASYMREGNQHKADSVFKLSERLVDDLSNYEGLWRNWYWALVYGDLSDNYEAMSKIFEKDPRHIAANYLMGLYASYLNRPKEVIQYYSYINPTDRDYKMQRRANWNMVYAYNLIKLRRFDEAIDILGFVPSEVTGNYYYNTLLTAYVLNGDDDLLPPMLKKMENENFSWEDITNGYINITRAYLLAEDHQNHKEWAKKLLEWIKAAKEVSDLNLQANAYYFTGDYEKAIELFKKISSSEALTWLPQSRMGCALARLGMREEAIKTITELEETIPQNANGNNQYGMAMIYTALGEKAKAVNLLIDGFDEGRFFTLYSYNLDPDFLPLHGYPAYEEFVKPKG